MFHDHEDARTQRSAAKIVQALNELLQTKQFSTITIADIGRKTGIARSTFYRSFDNLIDVMEWQCDAAFAQLFKNFSGQKTFPSEKKALELSLQYWTHNSAILVNLIKIKRLDIIYKYQAKYAELMLQEYGPLINLAPAEKKYFLSVRVGFVLSIILTWLRSGQKESVKELEVIAERQVQYLMKTFNN